MLHHGCQSGVVGFLVKRDERFTVVQFEFRKIIPILDFEEDGTLNQSEHDGMFYWLDEKQKELIKDFEIKHNAVVYHVIHSYTNNGEMLALLYVSDSE